MGKSQKKKEMTFMFLDTNTDEETLAMTHLLFTICNNIKWKSKGLTWPSLSQAVNSWVTKFAVGQCYWVRDETKRGWWWWWRRNYNVDIPPKLLYSISIFALRGNENLAKDIYNKEAFQLHYNTPVQRLE